MIWTKVILLNMLIFVIWGRIIYYLMSKWVNDNQYLSSLKDYKIQGNVEEFNVEINDLLEINKEINPLLDEIRSSEYFRIFKVNFDSECNFWTQNKICSFSTCTICSCDEEEIPLPWKQDSFKDTVDKNFQSEFFSQLVSKYNYSSSEWLVESEIDNKNGIYVNLLKNPETWTGYQGKKIWEAIYNENCFGGKDLNQMCLEERLFYKVVSGLHSNINLHLSYNFLKNDIKEKNETSFNNDTYNSLDYTINATMVRDRILNYNERVNNLFFLYSVVMRSLEKSEKTVRKYKIETGSNDLDSVISSKLNAFYTKFKSLDNVKYLLKEVKQNKLFKQFISYDQLDELKMRFRNISSIIDCVGCQKCKLHGKLQMYGLATMLKILIEPKDEIPLKRNELIAYINLASKICRSVDHLVEILEITEREKSLFKYKVYFGIFVYIILILLINLYFYKTGQFKRGIAEISNRKIIYPKKVVKGKENKLETSYIESEPIKQKKD